MNIWLFYAIIFISSGTVISWGLVKRNQIAAGFLAAIVIFFTRSIQVLNPYREYGDSYHYWNVPEAILRNNALVAPETVTWYPGIQDLLSFPGMHLMTTTIIKVTGIQDLAFARAIIPSLFGIACFAILVAIASRVIDRDWSVVVAYTIAQIDAVIFYQTEYHAQAFGFLFIAFLLFVFIQQMQSTNFHARHSIVLVFGIAGLMLAHRFSSILAVILFALSMVGLIIYSQFPHVHVSRFNRKRVMTYTLILGLVIGWIHVAIHTQVATKAIYNIYLISQGTGFGFTDGPPSGSTTVPTIIDRFSIVLKVVLSLLAVPTIIKSFSGDQDETIRLVIAFLGATGIAALITAAINFAVLTRVVLIAFIPLTLVAFYTLYDGAPNQRRTYITGLVALAIVMMGVMGGTAPSLIDPSSNIRADGYMGVTPMAGEHEEGGYWLRDYASADDTAVTPVTLHTATTFGHQPHATTEFLSINDDKQYIIVDGERRQLPANSKIYSNGRILVGYNK